MNRRILYLDAFRGLAVILMVQQHLQNWLWHKEWISYSITFPAHPLMLSLNFLGNFPAAMFLVAAGIGSALQYEQKVSGYEIFRRGLFILACGYLLNSISPHWFKPWSWYILHTIGISLIISPVLNRIGTPVLALMSLIILAGAAVIQTALKTQLMLDNRIMNNMSADGGVFRLIFAEGHFPLMPWLAFFITGIICCRLITGGKRIWIFYISVILLLSGLILSWFHNYGYFFATGGKFFRMFIYLPYVYPALPPFMLLVGGVTLLLLFLFSFAGSVKFIKLLSPAGRLSLTWFFIHIMIFNELSAVIGIRKGLDAVSTLVIVLVTILLIITFSITWERRDYRYSMEHLMRRTVKQR